jgi:hypothetical protein
MAIIAQESGQAIEPLNKSNLRRPHKHPTVITHLRQRKENLKRMMKPPLRKENLKRRNQQLMIGVEQSGCVFLRYVIF